MFSPADYATGTAAALALIRKEIPLLVPGWAQSFIPVDKEPMVAAAAAKCVLDAVAASHPEPATAYPQPQPPREGGT